jgi:choloylglycine hydrolase
MLRRLIAALAASTLLAASVAAPAAACTGIVLTATDGAVVRARTLEFGEDPQSQLIFIPRGQKMTATGPSGEGAGIAWTSKYAAAGTNAFGKSIVLDGLNEKGLGGGLFYFPGYAGYQDVAPDEAGRSMGSWELLTWVLGNFATVAEVKAELPGIKVSKAPLQGFDGSPPLHMILTDASGASLVVEYVDGALNLYDNPLGVLTNSPGFDWHTTNLRNFVNLSALNVPKLALGDIKIDQTGQGSGLLGLPGDFTPPSRFVRAVAFSQAAAPTADGAAATKLAFHILDNFDLPPGTVRSGPGPKDFEVTFWTGAADLKNLRYSVTTFDNRQVRMFDLAAADLDAGKIVTLPLDQPEEFLEMKLP